MVEDGFERVLGEYEQIVVFATKATGPHLELVGRFLAADIEDLFLGETEHGLEREGGLADARLTAQEYDAARNETATEDTVQFSIVHVDTGIVLRTDLVKTEDTTCGSGGGLDGRACVLSPPLTLSLEGRRVGNFDFLKRVPLSA